MAKLIIKTKYGVVPNHILNNALLSFKAKGLFAYLQSKPADWSFSVERISSDTNDGRDSVRSGLHELEKAGLLKRTPAKNLDGTWDGYDYFLTDVPFTGNTPAVAPLAVKGSTLSKKDTSKKEVVNNTDSLFEDFWQMYPNKVAKVTAYKTWVKNDLNPIAEFILSGVKRWKQSDQWERDNGRYIPHPNTFLNQRRWEDEVPKKEVGFISFNK